MSYIFHFPLNKWQDMFLKYECLSAPLPKDERYLTWTDFSHHSPSPCLRDIAGGSEHSFPIREKT